MGQRGPRPKPQALKDLQGTARKDRAPKNAPAPEVKAPSCPAWLSPEAKREWRRVVPQLLALKLLTPIDRAALAAYCQAYGEWWELDRVVDELGYTQISESGFVMARPEVYLRNSAIERMRKFLAEFGMTPAARTRIEVPGGSGGSDAPGNRFLELLK